MGKLILFILLILLLKFYIRLLFYKLVIEFALLKFY